MSLSLDAIPDSDDALNPTTEKTSGLSLLAAPARRRTVLRSAALAASTAGALVLGWAPTSRLPGAAAETGPSGLTGWDRSDCRDAYPNGYNAQRDTEGSFVNAGAACYGGRVMGSTMCDATGWHRSGSTGNWFSGTRSYRPISTACGATTTRNAWRWTVNGVTYRCSDGVTTVSSWFSYYSYLSICRARV